jgi:hypothetical protein
MRIEFMAPDEFKRHNDFRVDIQDGVDARSCTGGSIALVQSDQHTISGHLPNGAVFTGQIRVTRPHALVMLKLLALADRYNNLRGAKEARHDREEAQTHASDIIAILTVVPGIAAFNAQFVGQFQPDPILGLHVLRILSDFFRDGTSPGLLVYSEHIAANLPADRATSAVIRGETELAERIAVQIFPPPEFYAVANAIDDTTHPAGGAFIDEYLSTLESARISPTDTLALRSLPSPVFGGAYIRGATSVASASELIAKLSQAQSDLLHAYLQSKLDILRRSASLRVKYPHTLK